MKIFLYSLFLFFYLSKTFAGGSIAGNGGGLAEKNLGFALANLEQFISLCVHTPECKISEEDRNLLVQIQKALPKEKLNPQLLKFYDGKDASTFFKINGVTRVAKTGDKVGDTIFVNPGLLYVAESQNHDRAIDVPMATSILIHELGHHLGQHDHAWLDALGSKIQVFMFKNWERSEFWNGNAALVTVQMNSIHSDEQNKNINQIDQLILENNNEMYSLTEPILKNIGCPKATPSRVPLGLRIYNLHGERGLSFDEKTKLLSKPFRAWYILSCEPGKESSHGDIKLKLTFKKIAAESFEFLIDKTSVEQVACENNPEVCK